MTAVEARPALSVVIATTEGWPYVAEVLESVREQAESVGAEIVIADGSGRPEPAVHEIGTATRWLVVDENSVFALFRRGLSAAQGNLVATTEDHCIVRAGWCAAILNAHAQHPEAAAIGGAIENGSTGSLLDWASFFITQGLHLSPLGQREVRATTNEANLSLKRWAVERIGDSQGLGFMAILELRRLAGEGATLRVDDRMVVDHFQEIGFRATSAIHFHNGRTIAGFRRAVGMSAEDWLRMFGALLLPLVRTYRAGRTVWAKGRLRRTLIVSLPLMLWLDVCQGAGHLVGYAAGPGDSPRHLR